MMDIRNKLPFYVSDFKDCASLQCLASTIYLYLVCLCSMVAFGGMLGSATENYMVSQRSYPVFTILNEWSMCVCVHAFRLPWSAFYPGLLVAFFSRYSVVNH
ncbi:MAG: hypothetical protein HC788_06190, partial [Sphingopyxis sp.]|nr:hypothetical protein [Sphingopyxis sp.]